MCHSSHFRQQPICRLTGRRESESEFISFQSHDSPNIKKSNDQKPYTDCLSWVFIWSNICVAFHGKIAERLWNIIYGFGLWFQREESGSAGWVRERRCLWFKLTRTISFLLSLSLLGAVLVWCCCCWPDLVTRFPIYFIFLTVWGGQRTCTFNHRLVANESSKRERERERVCVGGDGLHPSFAMPSMDHCANHHCVFQLHFSNVCECLDVHTRRKEQEKRRIESISP